jgi:uncharacterized protein (DUF2236 family)
MLLAWPRAILLQLAHPLIAAGIDAHSSFRGGPVAAASRLHHTVRAMLSLTFGDASASAQTLERIRAIHTRVQGRLPETAGRFPAGTPYSAEDPALLLWVHATLLDSILPAYDSVVSRLTEHERNEYCEAAAPVAIALGAAADAVPRTWQALRGYTDGMLASDAIAVSAQARALAAAVLNPPLDWAMLPATSAMRLVTLGTLPPTVRAAYGWSWHPRQARRLARLVRLLRTARRLGPDAVWRWPEARQSRPADSA